MRPVGCAIAVLSLIAGAWGVLDSIEHWHVDNIGKYVALAALGGVIGLTIFVVGVARAKKQ